MLEMSTMYSRLSLNKHRLKPLIRLVYFLASVLSDNSIQCEFDFMFEFRAILNDVEQVGLCRLTGFHMNKKPVFDSFFSSFMF